MAFDIASAGLIAACAILLGLFVALIVLYYDLLSSKIRVESAYYRLDAFLNQRADLVPNLVGVVQHHVKGGKPLEKLVEARNASVQHPVLRGRLQHGDALSSALIDLFASSRSDRKLGSDAHFLHLQSHLLALEDKIAYTRQYYNDCASEYNTKIALFPARLFVWAIGFRKAQYLPGKPVWLTAKS